jgi:hypothetical protein
MVEVASLIVAGLGLAYGAYSGERQAGAQRQGRRDQERAQGQAEAAVVSEGRRAEEEENRARQRSPDLSVLLQDQTRQPRAGSDGIDTNRLLLGRPGLMGY